MFGIFKRKDKGNQPPDGEQTQTEIWGQPSTRKLTKDEAAREAAAQKLVEEKNQERRNMYRPAGQERIFLDEQGRRLVIRNEENTGPTASPHHPPFNAMAFWGVREIGHVQAAVEANQTLRQLDAHVEEAFRGHNVARELLADLENFARAKGLHRIVCVGRDSDEWDNAFLTQAGYTPQGTELVKTL